MIAKEIKTIEEIEETVLTDTLSQEEIEGYEAKSLEFQKKYQTPKVHVYVGIEENTNKRVVAYLKEPSFTVKLYFLDKFTSLGAFSAAEELARAVLIKEESDPLTYGDGYECDKYKLGVVTKCMEIAEIIQNQFKKK